MRALGLALRGYPLLHGTCLSDATDSRDARCPEHIHELLNYFRQGQCHGFIVRIAGAQAAS